MAGIGHARPQAGWGLNARRLGARAQKKALGCGA